MHGRELGFGWPGCGRPLVGSKAASFRPAFSVGSDRFRALSPGLLWLEPGIPAHTSQSQLVSEHSLHSSDIVCSAFHKKISCWYDLFEQDWESDNCSAWTSAHFLVAGFSSEILNESGSSTLL